VVFDGTDPAASRWARDPRSPLAMVDAGWRNCWRLGVPGTVFLFWLRYLFMQELPGNLAAGVSADVVAASGLHARGLWLVCCVRRLDG